MKEEYSAVDIARMLRVARTTVFRWIKSGKLKAHRTPGRHFRVRRKDLIKLLKNNEIPLSYLDRQPESKRILIIDDEDTILEILRTKLEAEGFEAQTAINGLEAGLHLKNFRPHLVLLDNVFNPKEGKSFCESIKQDPEICNMKIISISGTPKSEKQVKKQGFDAFRSKPFNLDEMVELINELLVN